MAAEIVHDAGWCWFADPRALYYAGKVFYGWTDRSGWIWVGEIDTATWTRRRFLIAQDTDVDDHNNPTLMIRGGRVCVFWCGHMSASMRYRVADGTATVGSFGPTVTCSAGNTPGGSGFTYPYPNQMAYDNHVYLLWRGGNFQPTYSRSDSITGNDWSPAKHLFSARSGVRPYMKVVTDGNAWLHFLLTDGHPHAVATSVYYVGWRLVDNSFRRADGGIIDHLADAPIPVSSLEKVYDGQTNPRAWVWDLQLQGSNIHGTFGVLKSREEHEYWSARHNGSGWQVRKICDAGGTIAQDSEKYYSGGVVLDPLDLDSVAVSRQAAAAQLHRIERWATTDDGATWSQAEVLSTADAQNVRPFYVRGAPAGIAWRLMWLQGTYGDFDNYALRLVGAP